MSGSPRAAGLLTAAAMLLALAPLRAVEYTIASPAELAQLTERLQPGDTVLLTDGTWSDQQIVFRGKGSAEKPITLAARNPGLAVLAGKSSIQVAGEYLVLKGIWVKDGRGAGNGVSISGSHCTLEEVAVTGGVYKHFVRLSGSDHRVVRCYLAGKTSEGPTLQIDADGKPNRHLLLHNHFGPRPPLRRNGGETIRIGYSWQSMNNSDTVVQENLFDRCDGEIEIISSKSCGNIYRWNTFLDCAGMLTLRHGNRCVVEGNFFFGNNKAGSGGIRVIGEDHVIVNNYIERVAKGGIWLTSGIPDSPLNGYHQARGCLVAFNTIVDSRGPGIELDAGIGTARRSLRPERITIANNLISMRSGEALLRGVEGDGFVWIGNVAAGGLESKNDARFRFHKVELERGASGLLRAPTRSAAELISEGEFSQVSADIDGQPRPPRSSVGCDHLSDAPIKRKPMTAGDVGPRWLQREGAAEAASSAKAN